MIPGIDPPFLTIDDAKRRGAEDARDGKHRNPFCMGSLEAQAYARGWSEEFERETEVVRVRIAGGEPVSAVQDSLDAREPQPPSWWHRVVAKVGRLFTRAMFIVCWNFARKGK